MGARLATWLAVAVGGTAGTLAALGSSGSPPAAAPAASLPLRPVAGIATPPPGTTNAGLAPTPATASATTTAASAAAEAPSTQPSEAAGTAGAVAEAPTASASARPEAPPPAAELLPLPTSKDKLLRQEMRCDQKKADSCIVAARSYESGSAGVTDPEKAAKYRRIALTIWIGQCDRNSSLACATLATMYRAGSGVPQSDRNADALLARAKELCRFNDAPVCHELPAP